MSSKRHNAALVAARERRARRQAAASRSARRFRSVTRRQRWAIGASVAALFASLLLPLWGFAAWARAIGGTSHRVGGGRSGRNAWSFDAVVRAEHPVAAPFLDFALSPVGRGVGWLLAAAAVVVLFLIAARISQWRWSRTAPAVRAQRTWAARKDADRRRG